MYVVVRGGTLSLVPKKTGDAGRIPAPSARWDVAFMDELTGNFAQRATLFAQVARSLCGAHRICLAAIHQHLRHARSVPRSAPRWDKSILAQPSPNLTQA